MGNKRDKLRVVDLGRPPEDLRRFCEESDNWILQLSPEMTELELEELYWRHATSSACYEGVIAEIASDSRTPDTILFDIASRFRRSREVLAALATNEKLPAGISEELADSGDPIVKEHVLSGQRKRKG